MRFSGLIFAGAFGAATTAADVPPADAQSHQGADTACSDVVIRPERYDRRGRITAPATTVYGCLNLRRIAPQPDTSFAVATERFPLPRNAQLTELARRKTDHGSTNYSIHPGENFAGDHAAFQTYIAQMRAERWDFEEASEEPSDIGGSEFSEFRRLSAAYLNGLVGIRETTHLRGGKEESVNSIPGLDDAFIAITQGAAEGPWKKGQAWCSLPLQLAFHHALLQQNGQSWLLPTKGVAFLLGWAYQLEEFLKDERLHDLIIVDELGEGATTRRGRILKKMDMVIPDGHSHVSAFYGTFTRRRADGTNEYKYVSIDGNFGLPGTEGIYFVVRNKLKLSIDSELLAAAALDIKLDMQAAATVIAAIRPDPQVASFKTAANQKKPSLRK